MLTGDIHSNWCNELRLDDRRSEQPVVATEFVATSLSSGGDGNDGEKQRNELMTNNACVKFHNRQRGYLLCTVDAAQWRTDYVVMDRVETPGGTASVRASFVVADGEPRVQTA